MGRSDPTRVCRCLRFHFKKTCPCRPVDRACFFGLAPHAGEPSQIVILDEEPGVADGEL